MMKFFRLSLCLFAMAICGFSLGCSGEDTAETTGGADTKADAEPADGGSETKTDDGSDSK